jgi:hypothetical protein
MKDKVIWVLGSGTGMNFIAKGIQPVEFNSPKTEPFIFEDLFKEFLIEQ